VKTPYYEIDEEKLDDEIALLQSALKRCWGEKGIYACSVKTNSLPWLLNHFREKGAWAEVVSAEEYDLVMRLDFDPSKVIYNGPIKEREIFEKVLRDGGLVNLDSTEELEWLEDLSRACGSAEDAAASDSVWNIGLRINVDFKKLVPGEVPADAEGSRFGYCEENGVLQEAIRRLEALPEVRIVGLHLHSSTKSRSVAAYEAAADYAVQIAKKYHLEDVRCVDMGGGFYGGVPGKPNFNDYVPAIAERLGKYFDKNETALILEPGVSVVSSSFTFVTSVRDVKYIEDHVYVVTDGSRVNLNPQVTRRWYPHHFVYQEAADSGLEKKMECKERRVLPSQMICGSTCMEYDRLFEAFDEPELQRGDLVVYDLAGGYTLCLTPLFIHYYPAVYVRQKDGTFYTAREPWTNREFLQGNHW
jgi:diaminopimelate decarboxylase